MTQPWLKSLGLGGEARAVALDFAKAFDKVWHDGLILKLERLGVSGSLLLWFKSYLSDRLQLVVVGGCVSSLLPVRSGVPQGSVLGPILFVIFINDLFNVVENSLDVFADDSTLHCTIDDKKDRVVKAESLQRDLIATSQSHLVT